MHYIIFHLDKLHFKKLTISGSCLVSCYLSDFAFLFQFNLNFKISSPDVLRVIMIIERLAITLSTAMPKKGQKQLQPPPPNHPSVTKSSWSNDTSMIHSECIHIFEEDNFFRPGKFLAWEFRKSNLKEKQNAEDFL